MEGFESMKGVLDKLECFFRAAFEHDFAGRGSAWEPLDIVRQIRRQIEKNRRVFVDDKVYVAHRMVIHLHAPRPEIAEEYEALFNNADFRKHIEEYIKDRGYQFLDRLRVTVRCHDRKTPQFGRSPCWVEFSWPQPGEDPGEVTVMMSPHDRERILSVIPPRSEVSEDAWLEVLEGTAYQSPLRIFRREFNLGRMQQVLNHRTGETVRVNHMAFARPASESDPNFWVSRRHARITWRDGGFRLSDTGSRNGTWVQRGEKLLPVPRNTPEGEAVPLKAEDILVLGKVRVRFRTTPPPQHDATIRVNPVR